jgi:hypothetical protein
MTISEADAERRVLKNTFFIRLSKNMPIQNVQDPRNEADIC